MSDTFVREMARTNARRSLEDEPLVNAAQVLVELDRAGMLSRGRTIYLRSVKSPSFLYRGEERVASNVHDAARKVRWWMSAWFDATTQHALPLSVFLELAEHDIAVRQPRLGWDPSWRTGAVVVA